MKLPLGALWWTLFLDCKGHMANLSDSINHRRQVTPMTEGEYVTHLTKWANCLPWGQALNEDMKMNHNVQRFQ